MAQLTSRVHHNVAGVALANKLARMAWAVLAKGKSIDLLCWSVALQLDWPADDARLRLGLEIASAISTSTAQRLLQMMISCQVRWRTMR